MYGNYYAVHEEKRDNRYVFCFENAPIEERVLVREGKESNAGECALQQEEPAKVGKICVCSAPFPEEEHDAEEEERQSSGCIEGAQQVGYFGLWSPERIAFPGIEPQAVPKGILHRCFFPKGSGWYAEHVKEKRDPLSVSKKPHLCEVFRPLPFHSHWHQRSFSLIVADVVEGDYC